PQALQGKRDGSPTSWHPGLREHVLWHALRRRPARDPRHHARHRGHVPPLPFDGRQLLRGRARAEVSVSDEVYGFDVVYLTSDLKEKTCHYVGSEQQVRRRTMLRTHAREVISLRPLTKAAYEKAFGFRGRM